MESFALNLIRKLPTTAVYIYMRVCLSVCVFICVCLCSCVCMQGGGEMIVLVVSVRLPNYLIMLCGRVDQDSIDNNCLRLP